MIRHPDQGIADRAKDIRLLISLDDEIVGQAAFGPRQRMIDEYIAARYLALELNDGGATRGNRHRLYIRQRRTGDGCRLIDAIKDLTDYMEGGGEVRAPDAKEDADGLGNLCS